MKSGKVSLDPTYFQQANGSQTGFMRDKFSTNVSNNKPGSVKKSYNLNI